MRRLLCLIPLLSTLAIAVEKPAYFISIDGLQPTLLQTLKTEGRLTAPHGFSWLLDHSLVVDRALPLVTSITAPSHISTITCSPPSRHGVIANDYLQNGKILSGFAAPLGSEPLWQAAMRQGRKVLSLAYVGADGRTPDRSASFGLAYPDPDKLGPGQQLQLSRDQLPLAQDWILPTDLASSSNRELTFTITLNPATQEKRSIHLLLSPHGIHVGKSKDLVHDAIGTLSADIPTLDIFLSENQGPKRRTILRLLPEATPGQIRIAVSKTTYNNAYPKAFRERLDALNLVWPDYSVRHLGLPLGQAVEAQGSIDRFLTEVAVRMAPELQVDLVLFYQPLLDTIGHELQARLPLPFRSGNSDEVTQAFVTGFQQIDQNLSRLLQDANARTPIALMGDHGMDAVQRMVNVSALLRPSSQKKIQLLASAQLLMLYPAAGQTQQDADAVGQELAEQLKELKVLAQASRRKDFLKLSPGRYQKEWQYGDAIWAFQGLSGNWLTYDTKAPQLFQKPRAAGMHGTSIHEPSMATTLLIHGPAVPAKHIPEASLIQAVPTFVQLMEMNPPAQCLGSSLLPRDRISRGADRAHTRR